MTFIMHIRVLRYLLFRGHSHSQRPLPAPAMLSSASLIFSLQKCEMLRFGVDFFNIDCLHGTDSIIPGLVGERKIRSVTSTAKAKTKTNLGDVSTTDKGKDVVLVMPLAQPVRLRVIVLV